MPAICAQLNANKIYHDYNLATERHRGKNIKKMNDDDEGSIDAVLSCSRGVLVA